MKKYILTQVFIITLIVNATAQVGINYTPFKNEVIKSALIIQDLPVGAGHKPNMLRFLDPAVPRPKAGQVLISDAFGNVRYGDLSATKIPAVNGSFNGGKTLTDIVTQRRVYDTYAYIDLLPGKWSVNFSLKFEVQKSTYENSTKVSYITYTTRQRYYSSDFYGGDRLRVRDINGVETTLRYNPATDSDVSTFTCNDRDRNCFYTFRRRSETVTSILGDWKTLDRDESIWARVILSDSAGDANGYVANSTGDVIGNLYLASGSIVGLAPYITLKGDIYINNRRPTTKRYYLKVYLELINLKNGTIAQYKLVNFAAGPMTNGIDRFFAIPAND